MQDFKLEPAHDLDVPASQRRKSVRREPGLGSMLPCHLWWGFARVYLKLYHRLEVVGRENLPQGPPFILVANHTSHLDALMLAAALPARLRRCTFPVSAGDVFFETRLASTFSALCLNALPMWRHHAGRHAMEDLRSRLEAGTTALLLFPEGTRSQEGSLQRFKPGIGMLTAGTSVPVLPCYLDGPHQSLPKGAAFPRPGKLRVTISKPMTFDGVENSKTGWAHAAQSLEEAVKELSLTVIRRG